MKSFILYTDGGARGNPGPAAAGGIIYDAKGNEIEKFSSFLGRATNNQAEYQAIILGLGHIQKIIGDDHIVTDTTVKAYLDSELIVKQLSGDYRIKSRKLKPLFIKLVELTSQFHRVDFQHVPRESNKGADRLVNIELNKHS